MDGGLGSAQNLRRKRLAIAAWIAVFGAANVLVALLGLRELQIAIAVLTVLALAAVAALQTRELRAERAEQLESRLRTPIKRVREMSARDAGVAPESPQALTSIGQSTTSEYLPRDIDEQIDLALGAVLDDRAASLIVVSGPSKAGKTRALFEAIRRLLPDAYVVAPTDAEAVDELTKPRALPSFKRQVVVLWLDDLELFLRAGQRGMHPGVLDHLGQQKGKFVVLATAGGKGLLQAGDDASQFSVPMAELLRHSRELRLSSALSGDERERLQSFAPEAAERIARDGIGEYMIAAPELERKLTSGRHSPGATPSPHGQAIAYAAIDWRRAGITGPIPKAVLRDVYPTYLPDHVDPDDAAFQSGLEWARQPLYSSVALLSGRDELQAYDHIVAFAGSVSDINEDAWVQFLRAATAEQAFELASVAYWRGKDEGEPEWTSRAERAVRKAMEAESASLAGLSASNLGVLLREREDLEGAEAAFRRADVLENAEGAFNLGNLLDKRGDLEDAEAAFRRAEERGEMRATVNRGNVLRRLGDLEGAEAAFRLAEEEGDPKGTANLGRLLEKRGDLDGAEAAFRRAEEQGEVGVALSLGLLLEERDDLEGAEAAYRRGEERGETEIALNLGNVLRKQGDLDGAEAAYRRADGQGDIGATRNLGMLLEDRGDQSGAEAAFRRADEQDDPVAPRLLGHILIDRGDLEGAEAAYRRADERGDAPASFFLGVMLEDRDDSKGAEDAYRRADERGDPGGAVKRGDRLFKSDHLDEAQAAYRRAEERGDVEGALGLGALFLAQGNTDEAETAFRRADNLGDGTGALQLGTLLKERGDPQEAEAAFRRAEERGVPRGAFELGELLRERGDPQGAKEAFARAKNLAAEGN